MVVKNLFTGQQWGNRHREQTYGHGERGAEGDMYGKSNMKTYITICKITNGNLLYDSGNSSWGSATNYRSGMAGRWEDVQVEGDMGRPMVIDVHV